MNRIIIKNLGPLNNIDIILNKVNVFMGPQSSGKSTIAKVISYCQWVEKRYILDGSFSYKFQEQFIRFHRIDRNYFHNDSLIEYESDYIKISYKGTKYQQTITLKESNLDYQKSKNIYIPAERNFVSVLPNLSKYKETNDNIMNFLYEWYDTKKQYSKKKSIPILNLGVKFHNEKESDLDVITLNQNNKEIKLKNASSGLQSVTPLVLIIDYLTGKFYNKVVSFSVQETEELKRILINNKGNSVSERRLVNLLSARSSYKFSNLIIEEPEQNLFPETQKNLVYYLLEKINDETRNHTLLMTTHSPYILYALNNCMMGHHIEKHLSDTDKKEFDSFNSWINPKSVSIWEIDVEKGHLHSIQNEETGTVHKHYFNKVMNNIMNEYYEMLNLYTT